MTTPPLRDAEHRRLDAKITGLLVITGLNLLLLIAAWIGIIDIATMTIDPGAAFFIGLALGLVIGQAIRRYSECSR